MACPLQYLRHICLGRLFVGVTLDLYGHWDRTELDGLRSIAIDVFDGRLAQCYALAVEPAGRSPEYRLLLGALLALDAEDRPAPLIVDSYLLRALAIAGYALATEACAGCGDVDVRWFSPQGGGAVCTACRTPGSAQLYPGDSAYLGALLAGDWAAVTAADRATQQRVDGMVVAYSTWHLERALRSLPFFER